MCAHSTPQKIDRQSSYDAHGIVYHWCVIEQIPLSEKYNLSSLHLKID